VTTRQIYLLRHAKSDWGDPDAADHDRTLNKRGRRSAAEVAETISREGIELDLVLVSTARRAVETAELAQLDTVRVAPELYDAHAGALHEQLRALPADVTRVLLVGHNPGMENLAAILAETDEARLRDGMSTATLLALDVDLDKWTDLAPGSARLTGRWEHPGTKH
jgi:phosphohistidine phosphatase